MKIAVLGTGMVGQALATRLHDLGHQVTLGTRDVGDTRQRLADSITADIPLATLSDAAATAEIVILAVQGGAALTTLAAAGPKQLATKIVIDITNPLDFTQGFPATLFVKDTDSLGEQIQAALPDARVVKTLNTLTADLMVNPRKVNDGQHTVFISGNDDEAKHVVATLLGSMGHMDVIDLGDITTARGTEMLMPLWMRLMGALDTTMFQFKVVR
jgi:8-hydroxy-5-deazaflavin:NADPH oxidoreductase